jgi:uncharacterized protein
MNWLADRFERRRAWIGALAALVSLAALFGAQRVRVDDVPSSIFRSDDEHFERLEQVFADFGTDDADCLVVIEGQEVLSPAGVTLLRDLDEQLEALDGVAQVWSLDDLLVIGEGLIPRPLLPPANGSPEAFVAARATAREHPLAGDLLLSADGEATVLVAGLGQAHLAISVLRERVQAIHAVIDGLAAGTGFSVYLTGVPPIRVVVFDTISREQRLFPPISALLGLLIGLLIFRRPGPVLITSGASMLAALWALGFMGWIDQPINLLSASLPLLVMVIAFTDAIHLMIDTLRGRREGLGAVGAAARSIRELGVPCALTSLTTAIGFGSLMISHIEVIQHFGLVFAASVGMSFVVILTVVPLASSLLLRDSRRPSMAMRFAGLHRPAERAFRALLRRPAPVAALGALLTGAGLVLALQLVPENQLTEATPAGDGSVEALPALERRFGGVLSASVLVEWPPELVWSDVRVLTVLEQVEQVLELHPFTRAPRSVLDLLELLPPGTPPAAGLAVLPAELTHRFLRPELHRALISTRVPDAGSSVCGPAYAEVESSLGELRGAHPGFTIELTGTGYVARRNVNLIIRDFALGLALAAAVIFVVLSLAFRSLRLGAVSLLPNAFPLVVAAAGLTLTGLELQVSSVLAFTVLLGIAVDDTIHFVCRYQRELRRTGSVDEALLAAFMAVGRALVMTTAALGSGFAVSLFSSLPTTRLFALIVTVGLLAALIGDLILLPASIAVMERRRRSD